MASQKNRKKPIAKKAAGARKSAKQSTVDAPNAIYALQYGFEAGEYFFSPTNFALAWIGTSSESELEKKLHDTVEGINKGALKAGDTPHLSRLMRKVKEQKGRELQLEDLKGLLMREYGTAKMIEREAVVSNKAGFKGTYSSQGQFSCKVESREKGQKQRAYTVSVYNALVKNAADIAEFNITGGSTYQEKTQQRGRHWGKKLKHEKDFVQYLAELAGKIKMANPAYPLDSQAVRADYSGFVQNIDYTQACALTELARAFKALQARPKQAESKAESTSVPTESKIKGLDSADPGEDILVPFDFGNTPQYAFEAFLMRYLPNPNKPKGMAKRDQYLKEIDKSFFGKRGFIRPWFARQLGKGFTRGVLPHHKKFSNYTWAIHQAWEEYETDLGRRFQKYAVEFPGTPFQTNSIVFNDTTSDISVRIIPGDVPYVLYKDFSPDNPSLLGNVEPLGRKNPYSMINPAKNRDYPAGAVKQWVETDHKTGKRALCVFYEPRRHILERASQLSRASGMKGISVGRLQERYKEQKKAR